ncbi:6722_t:CDS:2 [Cetraspora pellucida]|uniref:6722_t:CDS:1 n=1 Tax=Cetraspora pellucida TaxID=1433469 RepID=A0ACA9MIP6_9GLOM|nr:6722_t:CDS:2 [Cetraspora pellucida]
MSDNSTLLVSIIQDNITNKSSELSLEEVFKSDLALKKKFADNINFVQFGLTSNIIVELDSDSKYKTQLDLLDINSDNCKDETDDSISLENKIDDYISTKYDENTKYKSSLTTNFLICIELDPNNILCLLFAAPIII